MGKNISKKNEEKLRVFLLKQNDTKPLDNKKKVNASIKNTQRA